MNIAVVGQFDPNRDFADRIFMNIGEEELTDGDIQQQTLKFRTLKRYYLSTILTELAANPWIGARKRGPLTKTTSPANYSPYRFMYTLPADCVRPLEITGNHFFVIENNCLLTDLDNATLLYITNGYVAGSYPDDMYPGYPDIIISIDPVFYDYLEKLIASKVAMKISNNPQLHQLLYSEALLARREAIDTIRALSGSRMNGERRWDEYLNNADRNTMLQAAAVQAGGA